MDRPNAMRPSPVIGLTLAALCCGCGSSATPISPEDASAADAETGAGVTDAGATAEDRGTSRTDLPSTSSLFQMIDDMDHADDRFPTVPPGSSSFFWRRGNGAGLGNWFLSSPDRIVDASIEEFSPPRGDSKKACHVRGGNLEKGVDLWAQLDHPRNRPVDLSAYAGIAFWARLDSPSGRLIVAINDLRSGTFLSAQAINSPWPSLSRRLASSEWERFVLLFDDFTPAPSTSTVVSIDFVVGGAGEPFDLWIDDLMLLCRGICP